MGIFDIFKKQQPEPPLDEFTQNMCDLAEHCVSTLGSPFPGMDYSVASLKVVDDLLDEAADHYEDMPETRQKQIIEMVGAYIFEVARRNFGGKYFWYDARNQPILVTGQPQFEISLLAYDKVLGRIENGKEDNIPYFFQGYTERVARAKPGDKAMIV